MSTNAPFRLESPFSPAGDQPGAIAELNAGLARGDRFQTLLGITGSGPVSLMANATQFLFGLIWPAQIRSNLSAAYISANPQSASEQGIPSFWIAQRLGGSFKTLILAQLIVNV